jgi:hypothetical protein
MIITFPAPSSSLTSMYKCVSEDDPVRRILSTFTDFNDAIQNIREDDFTGYGFFVGINNPVNGNSRQEANLFFEKDRNFCMFNGQSLEAMPPIKVYKKAERTQDIVHSTFQVYHRDWILDFVKPVLQQRTDTITFTAGDAEIKILVSTIVKQQVLPAGKEPRVPLLVITNPEASFDVAVLVMDLLHCTCKDEIISIINTSNSSFTVNRRRKLYDIFPEEYIAIPSHILKMLERIECNTDKHLSPEDVEDLMNELVNRA